MNIDGKVEIRDDATQSGHHMVRLSFRRGDETVFFVFSTKIDKPLAPTIEHMVRELAK